MKLNWNGWTIFHHPFIQPTICHKCFAKWEDSAKWLWSRKFLHRKWQESSTRKAFPVPLSNIVQKDSAAGIYSANLNLLIKALWDAEVPFANIPQGFIIHEI